VCMLCLMKQQPIFRSTLAHSTAVSGDRHGCRNFAVSLYWWLDSEGLPAGGCFYLGDDVAQRSSR
jgi:hypothetical protein